MIQLGRAQRKLWPPAALVAVVTTPKRMALVLDLPILYSAPDNIVRQALRPLFQARPAQAAESYAAGIGGCSRVHKAPWSLTSMLNTQLASLAGLVGASACRWPTLQPVQTGLPFPALALPAMHAHAAVRPPSSAGCCWCKRWRTKFHGSHEPPCCQQVLCSKRSAAMTISFCLSLSITVQLPF